MDDKEAETLPLKPDRDPGAVNLAAMHALFARQLADASRDDGSIDFEALSSVVADVYVQASASRNAHAGRLKAVLEQIMHGVCFFDAEQRLIGCNRRYAEIYGLRPDLVRPGITLTEIVEHRTLAGSAPVMAPTDYLRWRSQVATDRRPNDSVIRLRNGRVVSIRHQPIPDGGWVAMHEDITDQLETDRQLDYLAAHDAVTGLLNRTMLAELLCQRLSRCSRSAPCAVLSLSLDRFEAMGDTLGRSAIDELLRMMSDRLRQQLRPGDLLGYAARNEFVIVCCGAAQPDDATRLARQLPELIARPAMLHGQRLAVTASVGVAVAFAPGPDPEAMLRNSRTALNRARTGGRGRYRQFDPEMDMRLEGRRLLELDLRDAVSRSAFDLHYQPQVNTQTRRINGLEALLRWTHPVRGPVSPELFIPLAEELGLIDRIGTWVLEQACIEAASWPDSIRIAVNVSALQLRDGKLPGIVANALRRSGLAPGRLELEITESRMLEDASAAGAILARLREAGVRIAMDDFGTGYSSLSSLASLPFDKVKVDRSLIAGLGKAPAYTAIVRALVSLCANLCISCTAEGVETEQQLAILAREHCPEVQGHLLGRPGPARDIPDLLRAPGLRGPDHDGPAGGATPGMPASASGAEQPDISFAQIVQTANDIIIVTTADLDLPGPKILYVNPAFTRLTGYAAHEALGLSPRLLQGPGTSRATLDEIGAGLRAGREVHQKVLNFAKSGAPYWLDLRIVPFRDSRAGLSSSSPSSET